MPQFRIQADYEMPSGAIAPAQLYAAMARRHMELYGTTSRHFAEIAVTTLRTTPTSIDVATLVAFDTETYELYRALLDGASRP